MESEVAETRDLKDIISGLTRENKKYVIAVANALLFTQNNHNKSYNSSKQTGR